MFEVLFQPAHDDIWVRAKYDLPLGNAGVLDRRESPVLSSRSRLLAGPEAEAKDRSACTELARLSDLRYGVHCAGSLQDLAGPFPKYLARTTFPAGKHIPLPKAQSTASKVRSGREFTSNAWAEEQTWLLQWQPSDRKARSAAALIPVHENDITLATFL